MKSTSGKPLLYQASSKKTSTKGESRKAPKGSMTHMKGGSDINGPATPSLRSSLKESAKSSSKMKRSRQPSFSSSSNVNVASQRYMKGLAAGTMMGEIQTIGDSGRRKLLHHTGRVKAERKMIETFNSLDSNHERKNSSVKE